MKYVAVSYVKVGAEFQSRSWILHVKMTLHCSIVKKTTLKFFIFTSLNLLSPNFTHNFVQFFFRFNRFSGITPQTMTMFVVFFSFSKTAELLPVFIMNKYQHSQQTNMFEKLYSFIVWNVFYLSFWQTRCSGAFGPVSPSTRRARIKLGLQKIRGLWPKLT